MTILLLFASVILLKKHYSFISKENFVGAVTRCYLPIQSNIIKLGVLGLQNNKRREIQNA